MTGTRTQLQADEVSQPETLRRALNPILLDLQARLEALEAVKGLTLLPEVSFDTGAALTPLVTPFAAGALRVSCPFTPTGVLLLRLEQVRGGTAVPTTTNDVKWHYGAGPGAGDGVLHIDFVTGLAVNSSYKMRLGVTRA